MNRILILLVFILSGANLMDADLSGATLTGTLLDGAVLCNTTMPSGTVIFSGC